MGKLIGSQLFFKHVWSGPQLVETTHQERVLQKGEKAHKAFVLRCQSQEDGEETIHLGSSLLVMAPFSVYLPRNLTQSLIPPLRTHPYFVRGFGVQTTNCS